MLPTNDQLKDLLLKRGIVAQKQLDDLLSFAKTSDANLIDILIENDIVTDENLGVMIADFLKIPFVSLSKVFIPKEVFHIVPERIARKYKVIPFARDQQGIKLAMTDPENKEITEMISKKTGTVINAYFATVRDIDNALRIYQKDLKEMFEGLQKQETQKTTAVEFPVSRIVDEIITNAYENKASDIHMEPQEKNSILRFRIDGILHDVLTLPKYLHEEMIARIKVLSRLRTDEHLSPQDGKMRLRMEEENIDIRVSIIPMVDGEKAVLRLLTSHFQKFSLIDLGMNQKDLVKVTKAFTKSYGMILSTGPTGSGKSTSIYAILKVLNTREKNITTIEDPVEYKISGINQIQVNPKTNLTFATGLRSILRQDPNIIFVGEIRDIETAGIAVNAALTGHLVLSTLHTNDAVTALPRLSDMKVEPFLVASTINVIIAQRLVRKICDICKTSFMLPKNDVIKNIPVELVQKYFGDREDLRIYKGQGCKICKMTGYTGRVGIFEVLQISETIKELITKKESSNVLAKRAMEEGMTTMFEDGIEKVAKGVTTVEEVLRVTKVESL